LPFILKSVFRKFSFQQIPLTKRYLTKYDGSVIFLLGEGGESKFNTNINYLLEEYGIMINNDAVVRTSFHKYHHPKEVGRIMGEKRERVPERISYT
jgi:intraflagellar transport protein 52